MSETIKKRDALDAIANRKQRAHDEWERETRRQSAPDFEAACAYRQGCFDAWYDAEGVLQHLPTKVESEWVSVEDRLPMDNRSVLVQYRESFRNATIKSYAVAFFGQHTHEWKEPLTGRHLDVLKWREIDEPQEVQ